MSEWVHESAAAFLGFKEPFGHPGLSTSEEGD